MQTKKLFKIKAVTNLHVGSGEQSFSVVDNAVQRDPVTNHPCIRASGLKGAFKEFYKSKVETEFKDKSEKDRESSVKAKLNPIFGREGKAGDSASGKAGEMRFLDARILALPLRSNKKPFYLATTREILLDLLETADLLGVAPGFTAADLPNPEEIHKDHANVSARDTDNGYVDTDNGYVEDLPMRKIEVDSKINELFGEHDVAFFDHETFGQLTELLPVAARNQLDNKGQSDNLFHEEFVPRQALYTFFAIYPEADEPAPFQEFLEKLTNGMVQLGANASIGYGLCEIKEVAS
jgi:CRISPR-associated protein Cmr4